MKYLAVVIIALLGVFIIGLLQAIRGKEIATEVLP